MKRYPQLILQVMHLCGVLWGAYPIFLVAHIDPAHRMAGAYYQKVGISLTFVLLGVLAFLFWFLLKSPPATAAVSVFIGVVILSAQWFNAPERKAQIAHWDLSRMGDSFIHTYILVNGRSADTLEGFDWNDSWIVAMEAPEFRFTPENMSPEQMSGYDEVKALIRLKEAEYEYWSTRHVLRTIHSAIASSVVWILGGAHLVLGLVVSIQIFIGIDLARTNRFWV